MVLSTAYFPNISWVEAFVEGGIIEGNENYQKQSIRNRCRIMTGGGAMSLVVPIVHNGGLKILIRDARIDYTMSWQRQHSRAVMAAYRSSAFWEHFEEQIMPLFELRHKYLWDMNCEITEVLLGALKIHRELVFTERFEGAVLPPPNGVREYYQVFGERYPFEADLSVLDLLFCEGSWL